MKRPARLRPSVAGPSSSSSFTSFSSMLSRVPLLLHLHDLSLPAWDVVGDQIPGLRIPLAFLSSLRTNLQISSLNEDLLPPSPLIPVPYTPDPLHPLLPHLSAETKSTSLCRSTLNGAPYLPRTTPSSHHENANIVLYKKIPASDPPLTTTTPPTPTATTISQPLTTSPATTADEIHTALHLIASTVSQQRQLAAKCILAHPSSILSILATTSLLTLFLLLPIAKLLSTGSRSRDLILMLALWTLCSLSALLLAIRYMVRGYSALAEHVGTRAWLAASCSVNGTSTSTSISQRRDEVLVARGGAAGGEIVGVLVLRIAKMRSGHAAVSSSTASATTAAAGGSSSIIDTTTANNATSTSSVGAAGSLPPRPRSSSSRRKSSSARWTGIIRAWSVKESHRRCGVGRRLLEEAVRYCRLRSLDGPVFADDHAHATQEVVLPGMFRGRFVEHDRWARRVLERVVLEGRGG